MNTIPGTNFPMKVYEPTGVRARGQISNLSPSEERQRRGLLAMIHIAKKERCLRDDEYRMILSGFRAASASELSIPELERLVKYLKKLGWKPVRRRSPSGTDCKCVPIRQGSETAPSPSRGDGQGGGDDARLSALRRRCVEVATGTDLKSVPIGGKRLAGLALKICGVTSLTWCHDVKKLQRLLAVLGKIKEAENEQKK